MANNRITIRLVGSESDGGDVRLSEFLKQLEAFGEALRQTERALSGERETFVYYKVVNLTHRSPATVVLEGVAKKASPVTARAVMSNFVSGVRNVRDQKKPPAGVDLAMLESYRALVAPTQLHIQRVEIVESPKKIIPIDSIFSKQVEELIGPDIFSFGSISGRLERINFHNTYKFEIFPSVGPRKVSCNFRPNLKPKVKAALDSYVTISGRLRYKQVDRFPYAIDARDVDIHEENDTLPTLHDLRGVMRDSTEGVSAEEFVRSIRDANW